MGIKQMQGTSAILEDVRYKVRKNRCAYNADKKCYCKRSNYYLLECKGRKFCTHFDDSDNARESFSKEVKEKSLRAKNNKKKGKSNGKEVTLLSLKTGELKRIMIIPNKESKSCDLGYYEKSDIAQEIKRGGVGTIIYLDEKLGEYKVRRKYKVLSIE